MCMHIRFELLAVRGGKAHCAGCRAYGWLITWRAVACTCHVTQHVGAHCAPAAGFDLEDTVACCAGYSVQGAAPLACHARQ
jgi:hypothetical protein